MSSQFSPLPHAEPSWGTPPWRIDCVGEQRGLPPRVDFAIVGGGFTGLAAAAWLRHLAPDRSVAVLEAHRIGAGASGRTGGIVLAESAAGDLPGLGDVLAGFRTILSKLRVDCDLSLPGAWELGRTGLRRDSSLTWSDSGRLGVVNEVPGGTLDPGKLVAGLARSAQRSGAILCENCEVLSIRWRDPVELQLAGRTLRADRVLIAANAQAFDLAGLQIGARPALTLAVKSAPLTPAQSAAIGLAEAKPFYTLDLPYLWGRFSPDRGIVFGSGLVFAEDGRRLEAIDLNSSEPKSRLESLIGRIRGLHPELSGIEFTHLWGGPVVFAPDWKPLFSYHPRSRNSIVLGAFSGHGVALSVYLGAWAVEALLEHRSLPKWT